MWQTAESYCGPHEETIILEENASYNLTSFHYGIGNIYGIRYACKYTVQVPPGHHIRVQFLSFGLLEALDVLFLDQKPFTGFKTPKDFISDDESLEIIYQTRGFPGTVGFSIVLSDFLEPGKMSDPRPGGRGALEYESDGYMPIGERKQGALGVGFRREKGVVGCGIKYGQFF